MKARQLFVAAVLLVTACSRPQNEKTIRIRNSLPFEREEVISLDPERISTDTGAWRKLAIVIDDKTTPTQVVDLDGDERIDQLLAYVSVGPNEERVFKVKYSDEPAKTETPVFSRIVPERIDDYAWENDRVAFRTYGPEAQRLAEAREPGGTMSSGIDCWLKRVDYPVIDKWYKKYTDGGSYHTDDGEGYDPYHVGLSRGCGGIGVWMVDSLYVSENFVSWRKIAEGPIRNTFELEYAPWMANGITIRETKRISIDRGSQLILIEELVDSAEPIPHITAGLTLHDAKGETFMDSANGVFGYWEKIDDAFLGTGLVTDPREVLSARDYRTSRTDQSHILVNIKPEGSRKFYAGFGWERAGRVTSREEWQTYLEQFSARLRSPLIVTVE